MIQVVSVIVEFIISISYNLIGDNHKSPVFSVFGKFFSLQTFFGSNIPVCLSYKTQIKCSPQGCHETK